MPRQGTKRLTRSHAYAVSQNVNGSAPLTVSSCRTDENQCLSISLSPTLILLFLALFFFLSNVSNLKPANEKDW